MININELESRHKKYKLKSYIPYAIILVSLFVILIMILYLLNSKTLEKTKIKNTIETPKKVLLKKELPIQIVKIQDVNKSKKEKPAETITQAIKKSKPITKQKIIVEKVILKQQVLPQSTTKLVISPSLNFMKNMEQNALPYYDSKDTFAEVPKKVNSTYQESSEEEKPTEKTVATLKEKIPEESTQSTILIQRRNSYQDIEHVIKRFKKNNNPALSLFVAKKYYELQEYDKSYNYALITNDINNEIEASWIIFAKSLVKLNKKEQAIITLTKYINHSDSSSAKILLDNIKTGAFK